MKRFSLDFETRSTSPIKVVGGHNYVEDPSTSVLCLVGTDGQRIYVWSPFPGPLGPIGNRLPLVVEHGPYPSAIVAASEGRVCVAQNAEGFDRPLWEALGLPPREWADTLPRLRRAQLPGKLEAAAQFVLGEGKLKSGQKATLALSKPVAMSAGAVTAAVVYARWLLRDGYHAAADEPKAGRGSLEMLVPGLAGDLLTDPTVLAALQSIVDSPPFGAEVLRDPNPAQLTEVVRYCMKDVVLMDRLIEAERLLWPHVDDDALEADRRINARGVQVDLELVAALLAEADRVVAEAGARVHRATNGELDESALRSAARLKEWLKPRVGELPDVKAETIREALRPVELALECSPTPLEAESVTAIVLRARLDVARVATGKLKALQHRTSPDRRLRGVHAYYQAHTGRWAGRGVQTQNLPRAVKGLPPTIADDLVARKLGAGSGLSAEAIGSLIRQCFVGDPGLAVVDFSNIEARAICYLAGDLEGMRRFAEGDPYSELASRIFNDRVVKPDPRRQVGKTAILGGQYGAGPDALERYAKKSGVSLAGVSALELVEGWRRANPLIAGVETGGEFTDSAGRPRRKRRGGWWKDLERGARRAVTTGSAPGTPWSFDGRDLWYHLPSGRVLRYREAQVGPCDDRDNTLSYLDLRRGKRVTTYGGKLSENVTQAFSRDFLAEGLVSLEQRAADGMRTVLHTHDEFVVECAKELEAEVVRIVTTPPAWAPDFALGAESHWSRRYAK